MTDPNSTVFDEQEVFKFINESSVAAPGMLYP